MATLNGTQGNDSLSGTTAADTINGFAGNDFIAGNSGDDSVAGGTGNDTIFGDGGNDWIEGGAGNDSLSGSGGQDDLVFREFGAANADVVASFATAWDRIQLDVAAFSAIGADGRFAAGDVRFYSAPGATGGHDADDRIIYDSTTGQLFYDADGSGAGGAQLIATLQGTPALVASDINVFGSAAPAGQVINGTAGNDSLAGGPGNDTVNGLAGDDSIDGAGGNDLLTGGSGSDSFFFASMPANANADTITDFASGADKIRLDASAFSNGLGANGDFASDDVRFYAAPGATAPHDFNDRVIYNTTTGDLYVLSMGSPQLVFTLQGAPSLSASDIAVFNALNPNQGLQIGGTEGNDSIDGTPGNDGINGRGGDDTINGGAGNDGISGDAGNDSIVGGPGADFMSGGDGNDTLDGFNRPTDRPSSGYNDVDVDTMDGGLGNDTFNVDNPNDVLTDAGGIDTVVARNLHWTLGPGFDNLIVMVDDEFGAGTGNELDNVIDGTHAYKARLEGLGGNDLILSGGKSTLLGGDGNDTLRPLDVDTVEGGNGDDVMFGVLDDMLTGGAGADTFALGQTWASLGSNDIMDFVSGTDRVQLNAEVMTALGASGTFTANDPRFYAAAGAREGHDADDRVIFDTTGGQLYYDADGSGQQTAVLIASTFGAQVVATDITVVNGSSTGSVINGTEGDDSLVGTPGNDTINGFGGNDTLDGGAGSDSLDGGLGNDTYVNPGGDTITDAGGTDTMLFRGPGSSFSLRPGIENLTIQQAAGEGPQSGVDAFGNQLDNVIRIETPVGWNYVWGQDGNDTLIGGSGFEDFVFSDLGSGSYGNDVVDGGANRDAVDFAGARSAVTIDFRSGTASGGGSVSFTNVEVGSGGGFNDTLIADDAGRQLLGRGGNDTLTGGAGNDTLSGDGFWGDAPTPALQAGDDLLIGGAGNDQLTGGGQSDTLNGGLGNDTLNGDFEDAPNGPDHFIFDVAPGAANADLLNVFESGSDKIHLDARVMSALGATGNFTANDARFYAAAGATGGHDADDRVVYDSSTGNIWYDADGSGNGAAQLIATLNLNPNFPTPTLAAGDIVVDNGTTPTPTPTPTPGQNIQGTTGNDSLVGGSGNDTIYGNAGNDTIEGRGGNDVLSGGGGQDVYVFHEYGPANADTVTSFDTGWDTLRLDVAGFNNIGSTGRFAGGDVRFYAAAGATGGHDADDRVVYNTSTGQLFYDADSNGAGSAQLIATFQNAPTMVASDITVFGTPTPTPTPTPGTINGTEGNDSITGTAGDDTINGLGGNDSLSGGPGLDVLVGGDGNDTLSGLSSSQSGEPGEADTLDGGMGDDVYEVGPNDVIRPDPGGVDTVQAWDTNWTLGPGLENLTVLNTVRATGTTATGNELNNIIDFPGVDHGGTAHGLGGDDTIYAAQHADGMLFGDDGNDVLHGETATSMAGLDGGAGNDTLIAGRNGPMTGGSGADSFVFANELSLGGSTVADFASGVDKVHLDARLMPGLGATGNFTANDARFYAAAGATSGHDADDRVIYDSSTGNLWYDADGSGSGAAQRITTVSNAGAPATVVASDIAVDNGSTPTPTPGQSFNGTAGNDTIVGTSGNDTIYGNSGNDWLEGRGGNDQLSGGGGQDSYVFREFGAANADALAQFDTNWDALRFDSAAFTGAGGVGHFAAGDVRFYSAAGATGAHDADDRFVYNTSTGQLYYDADGAGGADAQLVATVQGAAALNATDIWVI